MTREEAKMHIIDFICSENCLLNTFGKNCTKTECKEYQALKIMCECVEEVKQGELDKFFKAFPELDIEPYNTWKGGDEK